MPGERIVITKGDDLPEPDPPVLATDIQGRLVAKVPLLGSSARTVGIEDGFSLLRLIIQGFAATSLIFGLVYLQDVRRGARAAARTTSHQGLIEP